MDLSWNINGPMLAPCKRPAAAMNAKHEPPMHVLKRPAAMDAKHEPSIHIPLSNPLRVGSMCSGMLSEYWALKGFKGKEIVHEFAAEKEAYARDFILGNTDVKQLFDDVQSEEFRSGVTAHDVLIAGFPCQGLSPAGLNLGADDPRTMLYMDVLNVASRCRPHIVIIENVKGLLHRHQDVFLDIISRLNAMTTGTKKLYKVFSKVLNTKDYGLPQRRERVFIVAIALRGRSCETVTLRWPQPMPAVGLQGIWDRDALLLKSYARYPFPSTKVGKKNVKAMLQLVKLWSKDEDTLPTSYLVIADLGSSSLNYGLDVSPTLTKTRTSSCDYWSLQHGKKLSIMELARLQGHKPSTLNINCTTPQMGALIGNGFSVLVMRKVFEAAVKAAEG